MAQEQWARQRAKELSLEVVEMPSESALEQATRERHYPWRIQLPNTTDSRFFLSLCHSGYFWLVDQNYLIKRQQGLAPWPCDWVRLYQQQKRLQQQPGDLLFRSLGHKMSELAPLSLWDLTCGWGADTLNFVARGLRVVAFERAPLVVLMIEAAYSCLIQDQPALAERFHVVCGESCAALEAGQQMVAAERPQIIYLDPMFSAQNAKYHQTLPTKEMQFFRHLFAHEQGALESQGQALLEGALALASKRVIVKRALHAPALKKTDLSFKGKSTRYDVYVRMRPDPSN